MLEEAPGKFTFLFNNSVCVHARACEEPCRGEGDGQTGMNNPVREVQEGRTRTAPRLFLPPRLTAQCRPGLSPEQPGAPPGAWPSRRQWSFPRAQIGPTPTPTPAGVLALLLGASPPTPSLGCRLPSVQLWFPGNKTTIKVSGTAGDLHHILSCMDSIFYTQY